MGLLDQVDIQVAGLEDGLKRCGKRWGGEVE